MGMNVRRRLLAGSVAFSLVCAGALGISGSEYVQTVCGPGADPAATLATCLACCQNGVRTLVLPPLELGPCRSACLTAKFGTLEECPWYNPFCWL